MADRPEMFGPAGGFRGWPIQWNHAKCCGKFGLGVVIQSPTGLCAVFVTMCVVDWRLAPLVLFIKHWAKVQGINDASQGTVSSYSLVLMVIHYLQCKYITVIIIINSHLV